MQPSTIFALALASFHLCSSEPIPRAQSNVAAETHGNEVGALPQLAPDSRLAEAVENGHGKKLPCESCYMVCISFTKKCGDKCFPDKWTSKTCKDCAGPDVACPECLRRCESKKGGKNPFAAGLGTIVHGRDE